MWEEKWHIKDACITDLNVIVYPYGWYLNTSTGILGRRLSEFGF